MKESHILVTRKFCTRKAATVRKLKYKKISSQSKYNSDILSSSSMSTHVKNRTEMPTTTTPIPNYSENISQCNHTSVVVVGVGGG